jgi:nitrous oxidase accessory protein
MTIKGAGPGQTILRNAATWAPGNEGLTQDEGANRRGVRCDAYLLNLGDNAAGVTVTDLTLTGPQLHGGICGFSVSRLEVARVEFRSFLWAGVRAFGVTDARFHHNTFFDAGGKAEVTKGSSGGGLYLTYAKKTEIHDNRFARSMGNDSYGVKGREGREVRIHHNTIHTNFSIEFPHENDHTVEIDHNYLGGTLSIPKHGGGSVPAGGYTFRIHHNYFTTSYAIEYQRSGVEIAHNLFDFNRQRDGGNLISGFGAAAAKGGTKMHDNLIRNPGRGLYWNEGVYNDFAFYNNHVIAETTATPRMEGLFDFRPMREGATTDWTTIAIRDNVFELIGTSRPLLRNTASHAAVIENNTFVNVRDQAMFANPDTGRKRGPVAPLAFKLGAEEEYTVDGWTITHAGGAGDPRDGGAPAGDASAGTGGSGGASGPMAGSGGASAPLGGSGGPRVDASASATDGSVGARMPDARTGGPGGRDEPPSDSDSDSGKGGARRGGCSYARHAPERGAAWLTALAAAGLALCRRRRARA